MIDRTINVPSTWDDEVDLVIAGTGAAGLTCAIVAAVEGLSVLVLEKGALVGGTTALSGGGAWFPANRHTDEVGVEDSPDAALAYLRACAGENGEDEILVALVEHGPPAVEYLEDRAGIFFRPWPSVGGTIDYRPWLPGARHGGRTLDPGKFTVAELGEWGEKVRTGPSSAWLIDKLDYYANQLHTLPPAPGQEGRTRPHQRAEGEAGGIEFFASGTALISRLLKAALEQGATIVTEAPAEELIVEEGAVVGVRVSREGKPWFVRAGRGVVMATGGFGQNEELKRMWLTRPMEYTCEPETITGDGHLMGAAIGAQLAQLDAWWMPKLRIGRVPQGSREDRIMPHSMIVNRAGGGSSTRPPTTTTYARRSGPRRVAGRGTSRLAAVRQRQARDKYILFSGKVPPGEPPAWLTVAESVEELADKLGIDPG